MRPQQKNFDGKSSNCESGGGPQCGNAPSTPGAAGPHSALANLPGWQRERSTRLHRQFMRVEKLRKKRGSVDACFKPFLRYWTGEKYRSEPQRPVRISLETVRRLFYRWRKNGRTPAALIPHYVSGTKAIPAAILADFIQLCGCDSVHSMVAAANYAAMLFDFLPPGQKPAPACPGYAALLRALTVRQRRAIIQLHKAEAKARRARKHFEKLFEST